MAWKFNKVTIDGSLQIDGSLFANNDVILNNKKISGLATATNSSDAVNKYYVDSSLNLYLRNSSLGTSLYWERGLLNVSENVYTNSIEKSYGGSSVVFYDSFDSYTDGSLYGQGPWYGSDSFRGFDLIVTNNGNGTKSLRSAGSVAGFYNKALFSELNPSLGFEFRYDIDASLGIGETLTTYLGLQSNIILYDTYEHIYIKTVNGTGEIRNDRAYASNDKLIMRYFNNQITLFRNGIIDASWYDYLGGGGDLSGSLGQFTLNSSFSWDSDKNIFISFTRDASSYGRIGAIGLVYNITSISSTIHLVNDNSSPGTLKYYGTDISSSKGWYALPIIPNSVSESYVNNADNIIKANYIPSVSIGTGFNWNLNYLNVNDVNLIDNILDFSTNKYAPYNALPTSTTYTYKASDGALYNKYALAYDSGYVDWFLPEATLLDYMFSNYVSSPGSPFWSSYENDASTVAAIDSSITYTYPNKSEILRVWPVRTFNDVTSSFTALYEGAPGPAGGTIVYTDGYLYYEAAPTSMIFQSTWSNVIDTLVDAGTSNNFGDGYQNTLNIIAQTGHTSSAALTSQGLKSHADGTVSMIPAGWHLSTMVDIMTLYEYARNGGSAVDVGNYLADASAWIDFGATNATNDSGFTALPTGFRNGSAPIVDYDYTGRGSFFFMWAADLPEYYGLLMQISGSDVECIIGVNDINANYGMSVRLIKDNSVNPGSVTDYDGNVYDTTLIGTQVWTTSNFKNEHFNNGNSIAIIDASNLWLADTSGAIAYWDSSTVIGASTTSVFYAGIEDPIGTTRLNYNGHFHATKLFVGGVNVNVTGQWNVSTGVLYPPAGISNLYLTKDIQTCEIESNTRLGMFAGNVSLGYENVAIGYYGLSLNRGQDNIAIGTSVLYVNVTGNYNIGIGTSALAYSLNSENVGVGHAALGGVSNGSTNAAFGQQAGYFYGTGVNVNTVVNKSTYLGAYTRASALGNTNEIVIGYNTLGNGSNTVTIGDDSIASTYLKGKVYGNVGGTSIKSPDGSTWYLRVSDSGILSASTNINIY